MEKERRTKALLLSTLVVVVATLSIAFAAMSRTLSINGIGKMDTASWSVYFANLSDAIADGAKEEGKPNINAIDKGIIENINVKLFNPGDEISYKVDIVNDGTIDAEITMIKDIELTDVQKKVFEFKVTYTDTGEVLQNGDLLPKDTTKNITITIRFRDDITEFDLPTESQIINLSYQITYTQYDGEVPVGPNGGGVTTEKAVLAKGLTIEELESMDDPSVAPFFNGTLPRIQVESIDFLSSNVVPVEYADKAWDASLNKDGSVMAWYEPGETEGLNKVYIGGNGGVYAPSDSSFAFAIFASMKKISFNNNFNTSDVTDMSGMFLGTAFENLSFESLDTSKVTNMWGMFHGASVENIDFSSLNTSNVTNMSYMFNYCTSTTNLNLSSLDTTNVTNMERMFEYFEDLTSLNINSWNTQNVVNFSGMFNGCSNLTQLNISSWNTTSAENLSGMFENCYKLENLSLTDWNTSNVTNMKHMFYNCDSMTELDLSTWNTSKVTNMSGMFEYTEKLAVIKLNSADFSKVTSSGEMFIFVNNREACTVYVKDQAAYDFIQTKNNGQANLNIIIEPLNS